MQSSTPKIVEDIKLGTRQFLMMDNVTLTRLNHAQKNCPY